MFNTYSILISYYIVYLPNNKQKSKCSYLVDDRPNDCQINDCVLLEKDSKRTHTKKNPNFNNRCYAKYRKL